MLELAYASETSDEFWVYHFFIDQNQQGKGYGKAAMLAMIDLVRTNFPACQQIMLTVHVENKHARQLYEKLGFQPTGLLREGEPVYELQLK